MKIEEITNYSGEAKSIIDDFLELLLNQKATISEASLREIISSDGSHLFFAFDEDENCMGMLTIGIYVSPTGKKAWIEDVVVSEDFRGQGIGKKLMEFALQFVRQKQVRLLILTSRPFRIAANKLYVKLGFTQKETNVYVMNF